MAGLKRDLLPRICQSKLPLGRTKQACDVQKQQHLDVLSPFSNAILPWFMKGNVLQFYSIVSIRSLSLFCLFLISNGVAELREAQEAGRGREI